MRAIEELPGRWRRRLPEGRQAVPAVPLTGGLTQGELLCDLFRSAGAAAGGEAQPVCEPARPADPAAGVRAITFR
jgi:hypothetical protein